MTERSRTLLLDSDRPHLQQHMPMDSTINSPRAAMKVAIIIFVLAIAVRILLVFVTRVYTQPARGELVMVAHSIAQNRGFANPFATPTGPTAHVAPVYTYLLAFILKWIPWGPPFKLATICLAILGSSLMWSLLPLAARLLEIDARAGLVGGLFGALNPLRHYVELDGCWEQTYAALALFGCVAFTFACRSRFKSDKTVFALGCCWGLVLLLQPAFLVIFLTLLAVLCVRTHDGSRLSVLRPVAIAVGSMCLVITPWLIRNDIALGGPTFLRSNFGIELDTSNRDHATPDIVSNLYNDSASDHPDVNPAEARRMAAVGERAYYQFRQRRALTWIRQHPSLFLSLSEARFVEFWIPFHRSLWLDLVEGLFTFASFGGLIVLLWRRQAASWFLLSIWVSQPFVYYFLEADQRYRYPIEWTMALCAGYFAVQVYDAFSSRRARVGYLQQEAALAARP